MISALSEGKRLTNGTVNGVAGFSRLDPSRPSTGREFSDSIDRKIGQARERRAVRSGLRRTRPSRPQVRSGSLAVRRQVVRREKIFAKSWANLFMFLFNQIVLRHRPLKQTSPRSPRRATLEGSVEV